MSHRRALEARCTVTKQTSVLLLTAALVAIGGETACGAKIDDAGGTSPAGDGGGASAADGAAADGGSGSPDCAAHGGECIPQGQAPKSPHRQAGPGEGTCAGGDVCWLPVSTVYPVCAQNSDCNEDPRVSTLWGQCFQGVCVCHSGYSVQPDGKCGPTALADCAGQGGTCFQGETCPQGKQAEIAGSAGTNMTCGDFVAAVCCFTAGSCKGPTTPFHCCTPADGDEAPICVNGWLTCEPGDAPSANPCMGG